MKSLKLGPEPLPTIKMLYITITAFFWIPSVEKSILSPSLTQLRNYTGLLFLCVMRSPRPWEASILSWSLGRSATLSPLLTSASFNIVGPFNTTIHSWPSCKLNTSPYVSANCEGMWKMHHHLAAKSILLSRWKPVNLPALNSDASCGDPDCAGSPRQEVSRVLEGSWLADGSWYSMQSGWRLQWRAAACWCPSLQGTHIQKRSNPFLQRAAAGSEGFESLATQSCFL